MVESGKMAKKSFLSGVLLLSLSTFLVKIVGFLYKIPMLTYLGSVGMGYFHSAYEIYAMFCMIATAGLPVALSVLISAALARGDQQGVKRIFRVSMTVFCVIGVAGSALMAFFAPQFCRLIQSERAKDCIVAISPTVFFVCLSSGFRGYFQGYQRMLPTAISQLIEAVGKLFFGLILAGWALERGLEPPKVAAAAGWGLTLGTVASTAYLFFEKLRCDFAGREKIALSPPVKSVSLKKTVSALATLAIPMTLGAAAVSLTKLIDMTMILRRLQAIGFSEAAANEAYGSYTALALSVYALLPSLVNSISLPLIPRLSEAIERGDRAQQSSMIRVSYHLTAVIAIPAALVISAFAKPILTLLFGREADAVAVASPLLSALGVSIFLSCMITATNSVLHAYRRVNRPIFAMLIGAGVKILSAYLLIGIPDIGILGAPISTLLCNLTVVILNLRFSAGLQKTEELVAVFGKPLAAAVPSVGIPFCLYHLVEMRTGGGAWLSLACLSLAAVLYLFFVFLLRVVEADELEMLPMGKRLIRLFSGTNSVRAE